MAADQQAIPKPALILGLGGLIPFFCASIMVWWALPIDRWIPAWLIQDRDTKQFASMALGGYGAVILSFLGGVRWGNLLFDRAALRNWLPLFLSVVPSLIAWPALLLATVPMLSLLASGFILQYALDVSAGKRGELPAWFVRLRLILTTGAVISLLLGLVGNAV